MAPDAAQKEKIRSKYEDLLESCFDDEVGAVEKLLVGPPPLPIDPTEEVFPPNTDTPLGEAAAGNAVNVARLLIEKGAQPNSRGSQNRTPLHRAVMNEHEEVIEVLLAGGADPRMLLPQQFEEVTDDEADDETPTGQPESDAPAEKPKKTKLVPREWDPEEIPVPEIIKRILRRWDIKKTIRIAEKTAAASVQESNAKENVGNQLTAERNNLEQEAERATAELDRAFDLREARILEYDTMKCEKRLTDESENALLPLIKEAEEKVELLKKLKDAADDALRVARGALRKHEVDTTTGGLQVDSRIVLTQMADTVADSNNDLRKGSKCALLIDPSENGRSFLKYRNVVLYDYSAEDSLNRREARGVSRTVKARFLEALLGSIKQGRPFVLDLGTGDTDATFASLCASVDTTLYSNILGCTLIPESTTTMGTTVLRKLLDSPLLSASTKEDLCERSFTDIGFSKWRFVLLTSNAYPTEPLLKRYHSILVAA